MLGKIIQVDGDGSTLESDLIDGLDSTQFMRADTDTSNTGNVTIAAKMTSASVLTKKVEINGARDQNGIEMVGNIKMTDNDILGVQRFLFNDPGPDGRSEWSQSNARIFVAPLDDGTRDGF